MTPTCILINGPKGVGKTTAALAIQGERKQVAVVPSVQHAVSWRDTVSGYLLMGAMAIIAPGVQLFSEFVTALSLFKPQNVLLLRVYKAPPVRWMDGLPFENEIGSYFPAGPVWGHAEQVIVNDLSLEHYRQEAAVIGNGFIARRRIANER